MDVCIIFRSRVRLWALGLGGSLLEQESRWTQGTLASFVALGLSVQQIPEAGRTSRTSEARVPSPATVSHEQDVQTTDQTPQELFSFPPHVAPSLPKNVHAQRPLRA
eukprot:1191521-Prorocentrum_minimum.AAC.6